MVALLLPGGCLFLLFTVTPSRVREGGPSPSAALVAVSAMSLVGIKGNLTLLIRKTRLKRLGCWYGGLDSESGTICPLSHGRLAADALHGQRIADADTACSRRQTGKAFSTHSVHSFHGMTAPVFAQSIAGQVCCRLRETAAKFTKTIRRPSYELRQSAALLFRIPNANMSSDDTGKG